MPKSINNLAQYVLKSEANMYLYILSFKKDRLFWQMPNKLYYSKNAALRNI